jgi:ferric-dicitrate binding protein FerR (iron transport regulator)
LCNDISPDEKREIELLIASDDAFREEFKAMEFAWKVSSMPPYKTKDDWQIIRKRIGFADSRHNSLFTSIMKVAAVFVLVFSVSAGLWLYWNIPGYGRWVVFETGTSADSIVLPDQSVVFLNRNSSLTFINAFSGKERKVALTGEGYFEVTPGEKPFRVDVGIVSVKVLGTAFNLDGSRDDGSVQLSVTHGKVLFGKNKEQLTVKEGEWAVAGLQTLEKGIIANPNFLSWKTGLLEFNNINIKESVRILQEYFPEIKSVKINAKSDVTVTTSFKEMPLNEIIDELALHFEKKFELNNGILTISD